eukprot:TRINITY_DN1572_c0_g2_i1.p1 TRINITY_DN1572_c0_g2~~TRINITY_DN1572_c0_g2_i1.p1  ORF type:complete len:639 (-),score=131.96 TRINITY_DN1572_c0_g2_i1:197-2077(-)
MDYDNAKFRRRSVFKVITQAIRTSRVRQECTSCGIGNLLLLLTISGLVFLALAHSNSSVPVEELSMNNQLLVNDKENHIEAWKELLKSSLMLPSTLATSGVSGHDIVVNGTYQSTVNWSLRQKEVVEAFRHAWRGYKDFAMGYDELMPISKQGLDGLGGLGATIVDALDTAMIMELDDIVEEAGSWIEKEFLARLNEKGQVNLFETTIRILGGLLSAYHLSGGENGTINGMKQPQSILSGPNSLVYLQRAKDIADRLISAFTSSPTAVPFADVILHDRSARPAPDGLSSTAEVTSLQLEFWYLSKVSGDSKYNEMAMKVLEHFNTLSKKEGLVPIYISPYTGDFDGEYIRLGSRGDSYYEYLLKVWLQQRNIGLEGSDVSYLRDMYDEAMRGVKHHLVQKSIPNDLVFVGELPDGLNGDFYPKMDHLVCFLPGNLALGATRGLTKHDAMEQGVMAVEDIENLKLAENLAKTCYEMYVVTNTGLAPEIAHFQTKGLEGGNKNAEFQHDIIIRHADRHNLLRPETVESLFVLHRITEDQKYREWGWQIFQAFEANTKIASGGYSSLEDVTVLPPRRRDKMETFFLGETLKYLFLLFGDNDFLPLDKYVFNTEAHPLPINIKSNQHLSS